MSIIDRSLSLLALRPAKEVEELGLALRVLLASPIALQDPAGTVIVGTPGLAAQPRVALTIDGQVIGYLLAPKAEATMCAAAAQVIAKLWQAQAHCLLDAAAPVTDEQAPAQQETRADAALAELTARYTALAEEFDARVAALVKLSDEQQRQSYQAERLASVGALAAGVAHEINNPIAFVRSNLSTAETYLVTLGDLASAVKDLPGGEAVLASADTEFTLEDFSALLRDSIAGIDRVARIVNDLKGFSNVDKPQEDVVDINILLDAACKMAEKKLLPGARLICELGELKPLLCLPGHLAQAFLAVLSNAAQAIDGKGTQGELRVRSSFDGQQAIIEVCDNGVGIEASALARVFDPFYTTRAVGKGSGLGLTVARDIVRAHGGDINFDSIPGIGTTVTLTLPE
ncbi:ATP-binding protein [Accumulibacter sp.]|uniref:sensor histidine kinase n=1 Tax=Accumulibacter sp. TaxID=2053492 RepID=UPI0005A5D793|nr:ATP-binding protein [Accumulibacter sp.]HRF03952.1 ATP-binding protein [Accumulibacter sp.]